MKRVLTLFALLLCGLAVPDFASAEDPFTRLITTNTAEYNDSGLVVQNGSGVLFDSDEQLVAADTDTFGDVYLNKDGNVSLVTDGTSEGIDLQVKGASDDGTVIFIETTGSLVGADTDSGGTDVYSVVNGVPTLVSTSEADGTGAGTIMRFEGNTADGATVYFRTDQQMDPGDLDGGGEDIYSYSPGEPNGQKGEFVSTSDNDPQDNVDADFCGVGGDVAAYETTSEMTSDDEDGAGMDTYRFLDGDVKLASSSQDEQNSVNPQVPGTQNCRGVSADGSSIAFESTVKLDDADDSTSRRDVFTFDGVVTHWISTSTLSVPTDNHAFFGGMSSDGDTVFFNTPDQLIAGDTDTTDDDGYSRGPGGVIKLLTDGNTNPTDEGAQIKVVSGDSSTIVFRSQNRYVAGEADDEEGDFFAKVDGGPAQLVSTGPIAVDAVFINMVPDFDNAINRRWSISQNGRIFAFTTNYQLTSADTDALHDTYAWIRPLPVVPPTPTAPSADTTAPTITSAKVSNKTFAIDKKVKALTVAKTKKGTKISFTLSEAATVKLAFSSVGKGRKSGSKCVKETSKNKSAKKCDYLKLVKTGKHNGTAGSNSIAFGGKVGSKTLSTGSYQLKITATDAAGNATTSKSISFKIVKP